MIENNIVKCIKVKYLYFLMSKYIYLSNALVKIIESGDIKPFDQWLSNIDIFNSRKNGQICLTLEKDTPIFFF